MLNCYSLRQSGKFGIVSRKGTEIPFENIANLEFKTLKDGSAVIKITDKKGEIFYSDVTPNYKSKLSDYAVKHQYSQIIDNYKYMIRLNENYILAKKETKVKCSETLVVKDLDTFKGTVISQKAPAQKIKSVTNHANFEIIGGIESYLIKR